MVRAAGISIGELGIPDVHYVWCWESDSGRALCNVSWPSCDYL